MDSPRSGTASGERAESPLYSWFSGEARVEEVPRMVGRLREAGKETGATLQMLRTDLLAGPGHLHAAVKGATRSWRSGRPIARDLAMELLVYASGQRQIQRALELGLRPGLDTYVLVALGMKEPIGEPPGGLLTPLPGDPGDPLAYHPGKREAICRYYGITPREIAAAGGEERIPDLVVERVVLVDLLK